MTVATRNPVVLTQAEPGYDVVVTPEIVDGEVVYVAEHPALPGCMTHARSPEAAVADLADARELYLADLRNAGEPVPEPRLDPQVVTQRVYVAVEGTQSLGDDAGPAIEWEVVPFDRRR